MKLSKEKTEHVAKLANLPLTDSELEEYSGQLSKILDYIDKLNKAKTEKAEPIFNVSGRTNVTQKDIPSKSLTQKQALINAPKTEEGQIVTKGVFENE